MVQLFAVTLGLFQSPTLRKILNLSPEKAFDTACLTTLAMVIRHSHFFGFRKAMRSYEILLKVVAIRGLLSVDGLLAAAATTSPASSPRTPRSPWIWNVSSLSKMSG